MLTIFSQNKILFLTSILVSTCEYLNIKNLQKQRMSFDLQKNAPPFYCDSLIFNCLYIIKHSKKLECFLFFKFSVLRIGECVWKMERAIKEPKISVWQFLGNTSFILKTTKNSFSKWKNKTLTIFAQFKTRYTATRPNSIKLD